MSNRILFGWGIVLAATLCLAPAVGADDLGESLMVKVMYNEPQAVASLLEKGADVDYRAPGSGSTPLMMACTEGLPTSPSCSSKRGPTSTCRQTTAPPR